MPCVENRRWTFHNVTFATLNVQGTCNNLCSSGSGAPDPNGDPPEYTAREAADGMAVTIAVDDRTGKRTDRHVDTDAERAYARALLAVLTS